MKGGWYFLAEKCRQARKEKFAQFISYQLSSEKQSELGNSFSNCILIEKIREEREKAKCGWKCFLVDGNVNISALF